MSADAPRDHPVIVCAHGADSSGAVQLGAQLASALGQRLVLASAFRYEPVGLGASPLPSPLNEIRADAAMTQIERAERLVPHGVKVEERPVPAERIPEALAALALELDAALLVLGRDEHGHVTRSVVERAPCPVAVSPFDVPLPDPPPPEVIGVAYDGTPGAQAALVAGLHLAEATGTRLRVLTAGKEATAPPEEMLAAAAVDVEVHHVDGDAGVVLVRLSDTLDLLLCGSHGRGRVAAAILGSVSARLLRAAHCPVIVVPPSVGSATGAPLGLTTAAG